MKDRSVCFTSARTVRLFLTLTFAWTLSGSLASGGTIFQVSGPTTTGYSTVVGGTQDETLVSSWSDTGAYSDVSISAVLGTGAGGTHVFAYLMNQIGPGTTALANQIASATITPVTGFETDTLFSGLALSPGTYYLVLTGTFATLPAPNWFQSDTAVVTTDTGVTRGAEEVASLGGGVNTGYVPASTFAVQGCGTPASCTVNLLVSVTGNSTTAAPEPSSLGLVFGGALVIRGFLRKRNAATLRKEYSAASM